MLGFFGGFAKQYSRATDIVQSGTTLNTQVGAFVRRDIGYGNYYLLSSAYGYDDYSTERLIQIGAINAIADGKRDLSPHSNTSICTKAVLRKLELVP